MMQHFKEEERLTWERGEAADLIMNKQNIRMTSKTLLQNPS
jgi:hypothetical protein